MNQNVTLIKHLPPDKQNIILNTINFVKIALSDAEGGHDWWHIYRVWNTAKHLAQNEEVDLFVVELGALLHDIADSKFHDGDEEIGPRKAREFLQTLRVDEPVIVHIENIITNISFKGGKLPQQFKSPELDVIQDADRLDALGAVGIARTFNYGGHKGRSIYNPDIRPNLNLSKEEYKNSDAPTLNHFYEKLLLLKDLMNTQTGRKMAEERHAFMVAFLDQFYKEWEGEK
ncbi:MAG: HD domain-containing protein [Bacteroidota bacterium]